MSSTLLNNDIPKEAYNSKKIDLSYLCIFSCIMYVIIDVGKKTNWMQHSLDMVVMSLNFDLE